jgi:hypothetical protein
MSIQSRALQFLCLLACLFPSFAFAAEKKSPSEIRDEAIYQTANYLLDQCIQHGWQPFAIYTAISTVISVFLLWPVSKWLAGERGTFKNSLIYTLQLCAAGAVILGIAYVSIQAKWLGLLACLGLSLLFAIIGLARHVYEISIWRAIGFFLCVAVIGAASELATEAITGPMPWTTFADKSPEEQKEIMAKWQTEKKERERQPTSSAASTASTTAAPPTVQELYASLQKARTELNVNDPAAVARFNEQVAAYNVAKAAAAPPPPATASTNLKTAESAKSSKSDKKKSESKTQ